MLQPNHIRVKKGGYKASKKEKRHLNIWRYFKKINNKLTRLGFRQDIKKQFEKEVE